MKQSSLSIDASPRMKENEQGFGVPDGQSFSLVFTAGAKTFRTMRFYGDEQAQQAAIEEVQQYLTCPISIKK